MINISFQPNITQFSLDNAYALALASKLAYGSQEKVRIKLIEQGFKVAFIDKPDPHKANKDTQLFIAHSGTAVVMAFRGTEKLKDWLTNAQFDFQNTPNGRVHKGFDDALDSVWNQIIQTLADVHQYGQPLWITGHSLGGALAVLAAARLVLDIDPNIYKSVHGLYTFGQPRVGDRTFVKTLDNEIKPRYFRFVNDNDIVPRVPVRLNQYQHGGSMRFFDSTGILQDDIGYWLRFLERIEGSFEQKLDMMPSFIEHHAIDKYIGNIEKNMNR
jgi:triacylglycerol lipase